MKHRIRIQVKDMGQAKRFIRFCKKNGLIFSDMEGELHVKDDYDKKIDNPHVRTERKKNRHNFIKTNEKSADEIINDIIKKKTL